MSRSGIFPETWVRWKCWPRCWNPGTAGNRPTLWDVMKGRLLICSSNILKYRHLSYESGVPSEGEHSRRPSPVFPDDLVVRRPSTVLPAGPAPQQRRNPRPTFRRNRLRRSAHLHVGLGQAPARPEQSCAAWAYTGRHDALEGTQERSGSS